MVHIKISREKKMQINYWKCLVFCIQWALRATSSAPPWVVVNRPVRYCWKKAIYTWVKAKIAILYPLRHISVRNKGGKKNWLSLEGHGATVWPRLMRIKSQLFAGRGHPLDNSIACTVVLFCLRESFLNIIVLPASLSQGEDLSEFPW